MSVRAGVRDGQSAIPFRLLLFPVLFYLFVFVVPLLNLLRMSFFKSVPGRFMDRVLTLDAYRTLATDPFYLHVMWTTLRIGILVTFLALVLGYPLAYFLSRTKLRFKGLLLALVVCPLLVSVVVRTYGWMVLLGRHGTINLALQRLGLIRDPIPLIFNETGVLIGLTHVLLPFMVLSIVGTLQNVDRSLEDAAVSLGASRWHVFWKITWPLGLPGVAAGCVIVFILGVGSFVTPTLLGGSIVTTIPILAYQRFQMSFDWPFGSALAVLLLVTVLTAVFVYQVALRPALTKGLIR